MSVLPPRLLIGCALMVVSCAAAFWAGDRVVRMAATLVAACWVSVTVAQAITGHFRGPVVCGDVVGGLGLLYLAAVFNRGWLWAMTLIEACLFVLHAWFIGTPTPESAAMMGNNVFATGLLVVLVLGALMSRRRACG